MAIWSDRFFISFLKQLGFKMFLGVTATVTSWDAEGTSCSFVLEDNPLVDFVELPDTCQGLQYCNVLSGVIRGALEMVSSSVITISLRFYPFYSSSHLDISRCSSEIIEICHLQSVPL